jgi:hypothetical protein
MVLLLLLLWRWRCCEGQQRQRAPAARPRHALLAPAAALRPLLQRLRQQV